MNVSLSVRNKVLFVTPYSGSLVRMQTNWIVILQAKWTSHIIDLDETNCCNRLFWRRRLRYYYNIKM